MVQGAFLSCAICEKRKEKRFCPAVHGRICPQCCGESREVTLDCPRDWISPQPAAAHESARRHRDIVDHDLIVALTSMAQAYETLVNSGLHYESQITSVTQQAVIQELQTMVKEYREAEQKHIGQTRLRDADVLRALVFLARMSQARTS